MVNLPYNVIVYDVRTVFESVRGQLADLGDKSAPKTDRLCYLPQVQIRGFLLSHLPVGDMFCCLSVLMSPTFNFLIVRFVSLYNCCYSKCSIMLLCLM